MLVSKSGEKRPENASIMKFKLEITKTEGSKNEKPINSTLRFKLSFGN